MAPAFLFSTGGTVMSYDRFEDDWNGVPAPMVDRINPTENLFNRNKNDPPPEPIPDDKSRFVPRQYTKRPASQRKATFISSANCEWKAQAAKLSKAAYLAGDVIWHKAGLEKDNFVKEGRSESNPLKLNVHLRKRLGVSAWQMSRGIKALEKAGLLRRLETRPGKLQVVVLINVWLIKQKYEGL